MSAPSVSSAVKAPRSGLRRQAVFQAAAMAAFVFALSFPLSPSDVEVTTRHTTWSCTEGHTAEGTVGATFRLR